MAGNELPPIVTRLTGDVSGLAAAFAEGKELARRYKENVAGQFTGGKGIGAAFGKDLSEGIQDAIPPGFGKSVGDSFTRGIKDSLPASLPELIPPSPADPPAPKREGKKSGDAFVSAFTASMRDTLTPSSVLDDNLLNGLGKKGKDGGEKFAFSFGAGVKERIAAEGVSSIVDGLVPAGVQAGDRAGFDFTRTMGEQVRGNLPLDVEAPIEQSGKKAGERAGKSAGDAAARGMSPLIVGAFAAAATVGPGLILAGAATAVLGVEALATKGNAALAAGYQRLGMDASNAIEDATEPLIPQMQASIAVLDQGIAKISPELKDTFASIAPDATTLTGGLVDLVDNTLPGLNSGLRSIAPEANEIADAFGKIGTGIGGLFAGLGRGASGGTTGLDALATTLEHLLPDVGRIVGDLSNGLGPALHDVESAAVPVANVLTDVADALPPGAIRGTADAVALLYAAFKLGTITKVVAEGTTFTQWLGLAKTEAAAAATQVTALGAAEEATAAKGGLMAAAGGLGGKAINGLGAAASLATGPLGLILAGTGLLGDELGKLAGVGDHVTLDLDEFASTLSDAADGSYVAQQSLNALAATVGFMRSTVGAGAASLAQMDSALAQLYRSNPAQAAREYQSLADAFSHDGKSASDVAQMLPGYTQAVKDAASAASQSGVAANQALGPVQAFTQSIVEQQMKLASSGRDAGVAAVALLDLGVAQTGMSSALADSINAYQGATGAANAYEQALQSLNGAVITLDSAEAGFTIALDNVTRAAQANGVSLDVTNVKGAQNIQAFTGIAQAADKAAVALYQSEVSTKGANVAFADANGKLLTEKSAFEAAAIKAGFNKAQVDRLADSLYKLPSDIPIDVSLNTGSAVQSLHGLIQRINSSTGTVQVYAQTHDLGGGKIDLTGGGKALGGRASGGPVDAGVPYLVGENHRPEIFVPGASGYITPVDRLQPAMSAGFSSGGAVHNHYHVTVQAGAVGSEVMLAQTIVQALTRWGSRTSNQQVSYQSVRGLKSA